MKNNNKQGTEADYLKEARSWETSKVTAAEQSKKIAWRVASVSLVLALLSVVAVLLLTPLKQVTPFVIRVDNSTGAVDIVNALRDGETTYDEALNKYWLQKYVTYRETYSKAVVEDYYYNVGLMSGQQEQQAYFNALNPNNPQSPINVYGDYAKVKIQIKGTSFINDDVALVRYTRRIERGSAKPELTHWAATVTFRYTQAPMSEKDRGINPLGFQVMDYRNDPDSIIEASEPVVVGVPAPIPARPSVVVAPTVQAGEGE